jgi:hypothetical protein
MIGFGHEGLHCAVARKDAKQSNESINQSIDGITIHDPVRSL